MKTAIMVLCVMAACAVHANADDFVIPHAPNYNMGQIYPFDSRWGDWRYQWIIPAKYLSGKNCLITQISVGSYEQNTFTARTFEMSMSHNLQTGTPSMHFAANMPRPRVVIPARSVSFLREWFQWSAIRLTHPFAYNGTDGLTIELRYKGGAILGTNGVGTCARVGSIGYQCSRVYRYGTGAYTSTLAQAVDAFGTLVIKLTYLDVTIAGSGSTSVGGTLRLGLLAPDDGGLPYQVATSLGVGPIHIGSRSLDLDVDGIMIASVGGYLPTIFRGYAGRMSSTGTAQAEIAIPNDAGLIGLRLHSAFVTAKPGEPQNLKTISRTYSFTITQ